MTRSSHRKKSKHVALLSVLGVLLVLISFYTYRSTYYTKHFLPNTEINGINVSNLTVEKANEKLKEAYSKVNSKVEVEIQQSDSSTGITNAIEGTADIGMASRDLKDEETSKGVSSTVIAIDGIAVIVNKDNKVDGLTSEQVKTIFTGKTTSWYGLSD